MSRDVTYSLLDIEGPRASRWKLVAGYTRFESGVKSPRMPQRDGDCYARTTTAIDHPHRPPTQDAGASEAARDHDPKACAPLQMHQHLALAVGEGDRWR